MMYDEFIERVTAIDGREKRNVTNDEYQIIEIVYTFYPNLGNKDEVAEMFTKYGMPIFIDMLPRAQAIADIETEIQQNKKALELIKIRQQQLYK